MYVGCMLCAHASTAHKYVSMRELVGTDQSSRPSSAATHSARAAGLAQEHELQAEEELLQIEHLLPYALQSHFTRGHLS